MHALHDYVIVVEESSDNQEQKTTGGIILTQPVETGHKPARVIAVGPEVKHIHPGQKCYCKWSDALPFTDDGIKMAALRQESVFAVFVE